MATTTPRKPIDGSRTASPTIGGLGVRGDRIAQCRLPPPLGVRGSGQEPVTRARFVRARARGRRRASPGLTAARCPDLLTQLGKLSTRRGKILACLRTDLVAIGLQPSAMPRDPVVEVVLQALRPATGVRRRLPLGGGASKLKLSLSLSMCRSPHQRIRLLARRRHRPTGRRDHGIRQSERLGDIQRVGGAVAADRDRIARAQGRRIDRNGRVLGPWEGDRPLLERPEVGRDQDQRARADQPLQDRLGQGTAFIGIGARGDLVQQYQRAAARRGDDLREAAHVGRERREVQRNRLFVADVRQDPIEDREPCRARGHAQPALGQRRKHAQRLECHGLAAGVRPADDQRTDPLEVEIDRHRPLGIQQRVAGGQQLGLRRVLDDASLPFVRQPGASEREIVLGQRRRSPR